MTRKQPAPRKPQTRRTVTTEYVADEPGTDDVLPDFDPSAEETFTSFRQKFGTEGVLVKIYRKTARGIQYCYSGLPSEIDEETVRLYHAKQPYAHEEGEYSARCFVHGEPRDSFQILIAPQIAMPGQEPQQQYGGMAGQGELVRMLMAQIDRLEARLNNGSEREPLSQVADALVKLQSLQPKTELMPDQIMKWIEVGKMAAGAGGATESEWTPVIKEALTQVGPIIAGMIGGMGQRTQQQPAIAGGNVVAGQNEEAMFKGVLAFLKKKCLAGSHPQLYIEVVLDNRDDAIYQRLIHKILSEDFSTFAAVDPEINTPSYEPFFRFIYDGLRSRIEEENKMASAPGGETGDSENPPGDGQSSKASGGKS